MTFKLILASSSPRRIDLLKQISITPDKICPAQIDETPSAKEIPLDYAKRMAVEKGLKISNNSTDFVLAADTVVSLGRRILPKAIDDNDVKNCLKLLSGRSHTVITSVVLCKNGDIISHKTNSTKVKFKRLSDEELNDYVQSKEGLDKAGGYAIQGLAGSFVKSINGSYSSVVGLPLFETKNILNQLNLYK